LLQNLGNFVTRNWKILRPGKRETRITIRMMTPPEAPLMTDNTSCGPFMCVMMDLYCCGIPFNDFKRYINQDNIVEARRRIAEFMNGFCCRFIILYISDKTI
jgi:hypothetical protein